MERNKALVVLTSIHIPDTDRVSEKLPWKALR